MSTIRPAQFQEAAVDLIVSRLRDKEGSRRLLLADEVGLGKTVVARGVIERLMERRRGPLTVIYLCSNSEIAEQNRIKLDPESGRPVGRVTELALSRPDTERRLLLFSFTPGTSLKDGTGLAWERRLLMYLLHRIYGFPVWSKSWRQLFRCGAGEERWNAGTTRRALFEEFERKTSRDFQSSLAAAWREIKIDGHRVVLAVRQMAAEFDPHSREERTRRNRLVMELRREMQRMALRHLEPDLVILDEVQRFREVLDAAANQGEIAGELFEGGVPVLILSATPYRALTLGHEVTEGESSHHEDFFKTLDFLFDKDRVTPARIRSNLKRFGGRLRLPGIADQLDAELLDLKRSLEADLTRVICRTERNWYVLDHRKGIDDDTGDSGALPGKGELEEFFRLHNCLAASSGMGQVTEFWKSAPSLLTFLDSKYALLKRLDAEKVKVPRTLLTPGSKVSDLADRNHRISRVIRVSLGAPEAAPRLWTAPTYFYYRDEFYGTDRPRKMLVFSGWRFVPKTVAIITSRAALDRLTEDGEESTQPLRFSDKRSFHVFDVCFPSPVLADAGMEAQSRILEGAQPSARDLIEEAANVLRARLAEAGIAVVPRGSKPTWAVVMRLERRAGNAALIRQGLDAWVADDKEDGAAANAIRHREWARQWLADEQSSLQISEQRLQQLALVAAFSPAASVWRALQSVFGREAAKEAFPHAVGLCLGPMRRYFNRAHVQQIIRQHGFRMLWHQMSAEDERRFTERVLVYAGDAHLQAVLDEYVYLSAHLGPQEAIRRLGDIWALAQGNPRTNGPSGAGVAVRIKAEAESHATHFALAFGEDVARDAAPDSETDDEKVRKSVVREAFNSPFWPFVLATTSVGQEGLDFHLYCRDVLHWNLPSNPVDLEQREGRVNRRDCLAVRESVAKDWPNRGGALWAGRKPGRNPWTVVFEQIQGNEDLQKYKHGLYPHWVYECRNAQDTVRIQRHVPFFSTSRDARKYERLKTGLALYRLVFGQVNQEHLLESLERQLADRGSDERNRVLKRLASYMLNLSPIGHEQAIRHADDEANTLLTGYPSGNGLSSLLREAEQMLVDRPLDLADVAQEVRDLVRFVETALPSRDRLSARVKGAVAALAYLRNPYDRIFDLHVEGGFADDIAVIKQAWARCQ